MVITSVLITRRQKEILATERRIQSDGSTERFEDVTPLALKMEEGMQIQNLYNQGNKFFSTVSEEKVLQITLFRPAKLIQTSGLQNSKIFLCGFKPLGCGNSL